MNLGEVLRVRTTPVEGDDGRLHQFWEENCLSSSVGHARSCWLVAGWLQSPAGTIRPLSNPHASRIIRASPLGFPLGAQAIGSTWA